MLGYLHIKKVIFIMFLLAIGLVFFFNYENKNKIQEVNKKENLSTFTQGEIVKFNTEIKSFKDDCYFDGLCYFVTNEGRIYV